MDPPIQLGIDAKTGRPISLPLSLFRAAHTWIMGMTGSFKTTYAAQLVTQLRALDPTAAIVVADFGGSQVLFHLLLAATLAANRRFRFLSTMPDDDWDYFEPLRAVTPLREVGIVHATSLLASSLGLDHGEGYARSWYGRVNLTTIFRTFRELQEMGNEQPTLREFARHLARAARRPGIRELSEAQLAAELLLSYEQLGEGDDPDRQIEPARCLEEGDTIFGFLPTLLEPTARMVGSLLVWSFVLEAMRRTHAGLPRRQTYVLCDEYQVLAPGLSDLLTQARKHGVTLIVLNQTSAQLVGDQDFRDIAFANTGIKVWFTPLGDDIETLQGLSLDVVKTRGKTVSSRNLTGSVSLREEYEPDLERNDVLETAFTGLEAMLIMNDFGGHREPIRMRVVPTLTREQHAELSNRPLPKRPASPPPTPGRRRPSDPHHATRVAALNALLAQKQAEEDWQRP